MCILVLLISTSVIIVTSSIVVFIISSACKHCSPNSECLRGSSDVSVPGANVCPFVTTCPGFGFYGPANTFYAHARYLVMVRRRFYCKKHCFIHVLQLPSQQNRLIINVFETSSHRTLQNTLFLITRGPPGRLFMRTRGSW